MLVTSHYGPRRGDYNNLPERRSNEGEREWRGRMRSEMKMKINVWARSPSPPNQRGTGKEKKEEKIKPKIKEKDETKTDSFGRIRYENEKDLHRDFDKKDKKKKDRKRGRSPSNSSDSDSVESSDDSDSYDSDDSDVSEDTESSDSYKKKKSSKRKYHSSKRKEKSSRRKKSSSKKKSKKSKSKKRRRRSRSDSDSDSESSSSSDRSKVRKNKNILDGDLKSTTQPGASVDKFDEYDLEEAARFRQDVQGGQRLHDDDEDDDIGPQPMVKPKEYAEESKISYGGALLPGEGAAIAQYVQQNMRIPRRGEIGWQGEEIEALENQGYVMSGSRHARMNAVRLRKENQVYSAEEKRALALITFEEKQQKNNKIVGDFRAMLTKKLGSTGAAGAGQPTEDYAAD